MDVMNDLLNLKLAIQSNNREFVENIYELYKNEMPSFSLTFSYEQLTRLEMDTMASDLIPDDLPLPLHKVLAIKTLGNGNCLFNSVSFLLCHSYKLSSVLRLLTAAELFVNANQYVNHPKLQFAYDCPDITCDRETLFAMLLSKEASSTSNHIEAVKKEAAVTCNDRQWSGMFDILGLASVLKKNIWSVYPDCNDNIRPLINGVVEPLTCTISPSDLENTLFILWSRDGDFDSTPGQPFETNHFVPIVYKPASPDELRQNYEEPRFKTMRVIEGRNYMTAAKPRSHTDEDKEDDDKKVYKTKKVLFLDSHGVKNFPYRGRRRYFSYREQILGSRTDRHNDLFGLTIFQFEREFKACQERRKQNEPHILNILFPIKTDNRCLEYLENTQSQQTDHTSLFSPQEKEVYDNLIRVVGSETDIRIRQNMFLIMDKIFNKASTCLTRVSAGSLAEGLDLPGSDIDVMFVFKGIKVIQNVQHMNRSAQCTTLLIEDDMAFPGFSRLKFIAGDNHQCFLTSPECFVQTINGLFLSNILFLHKFTEAIIDSRISTDGPYLSDMDMPFCFHLHTWPRQAEQWICRHRPGQWPTDILINQIINYGCILVPIGPKEIDNNELLWRISFSVAEKQLSHSMNYTQILCYALLKLSLKNIIDRNDKVKGLLCSYFMKTAVFWLSEKICANTFKLQNLFHCYVLCLDKIITWVKCCYCPNYFIPEHNMFRGKINRSNRRQLLNVLERLRNGELQVFTINTLFNREAVLHESCAGLEVFLYKIIDTYVPIDIEQGYTLLSFIKSLAMLHSTSILSGLCKYYYAIFSQMIVQRLPFPTTNISNAHIIRRYHKHLHDGTKSDAVTGWLLYASFYYVLGQYNTTLKIIDYVLSRCTPDMIMLYKTNYTTNDIKYYKQNVCCSNITLNGKMRLATIRNMRYFKRSTLIPHELRPEVQDDPFGVPPVVMSHCLRFLCYHHLYNIVNRQQSLRDLYLTIKERHFVSDDTLSNSLTILGVCNEIAGDKEAAYYCYDAALQCEYIICPTAAKRKVNLNMT